MPQWSIIGVRRTAERTSLALKLSTENLYKIDFEANLFFTVVLPLQNVCYNR